MLKILQYNVYFEEQNGVDFDRRFVDVCKHIINVDADVICLQEVPGIKRQYIIDSLMSHYPYYLPDEKDDDSDNRIVVPKYATMIFSKYSFQQEMVHKFEFTNMGRDIKIVLIEKDGLEAYICTSHFESEFGKGIKYKKFQYKRCASILGDLHVKTNIPVILCADTNVCEMSEDDFCNSYLFNSGSFETDEWKDTWIETGASNKTRYTFDSKTNPLLIAKYRGKGIQYQSRLDRIVHLSNLQCFSHKLIGIHNNKNTPLSDHYGILCEFTKIDKNQDDDENNQEYSKLLEKAISSVKTSKGKSAFDAKYNKSMF